MVVEVRRERGRRRRKEGGGEQERAVSILPQPMP
jgi:hypothetical protein